MRKNILVESKAGLQSEVVDTHKYLGGILGAGKAGKVPSRRNHEAPQGKTIK